VAVRRPVGPVGAVGLLEPGCRSVRWCRRREDAPGRTSRDLGPRDPRPVGAERTAAVWLPSRIGFVGPGWAGERRAAGGPAVHPRVGGTVGRGVAGLTRCEPVGPRAAWGLRPGRGLVLRPRRVGVPAGGWVRHRSRWHAWITRARRRRRGGSHGPLVPVLQVVATLSRVGTDPVGAVWQHPVTKRVQPGGFARHARTAGAAWCRPLYQPVRYCLASGAARRAGQSAQAG
jgi:hypothetical protein